MTAKGETGPRKSQRDTALVVCPACHYGFPDTDPEGHAYVCPRRECGHHWEPDTQTLAAVHAPQGRQPQPELRVVAGASPAHVQLREGETLIGRDPQCSLLLDNLVVSRQHARVQRRGDQAWIEDLGSPYGTLVNGKPIEAKTVLTACDELVIGGVTLRYAVRFTPAEVGREWVDNSLLIAQGAKAAPQLAGIPAEFISLPHGRLTFGRAADRDIVLPDAMISRRHALLEYQGGAYYLGDTQSRIGTFVNGQSIIRVRLETGDRIQLGPYLFLFEGTRLRRILHPTSLGVVASGLNQIAGSVPLLQDVNLVLRPGEFVGLLGPSGAGKTTLLDALNGLRPARSGQVYINGERLYEQYERLRHLIGYVPQEDLIHRELTCRQALTYAGRLRLPPDVTAAELTGLVEETLTALDLSARADVPIARLSGGQRKRASVGVELLSKPGLLFLDEPTSGLDPGTESLLMRKFQQLAQQGRTVVCTTHVMENVDLFDEVAVLAPGGRLAYFGPPGDAKAYFGIEKFTRLYDRLEEKAPEAWQEQFRRSNLCRERLRLALEASSPQAPQRQRRRLPRARVGSALSQWGILARRFGRILGSDMQNIALLVAQPLVIAALICLIFHKNPPLIGFLVVLSALWFGCSSAAQQIVKERAIFRRERMVNLRLDAYILSKFLPLAVVSMGQGALMLLIVWLARSDDAQSGQGRLIQALAVALASWNGVALGLVISALASNADKAMSVVPLVLMPQIMLAGVMVALPEMNLPTWLASHLVISRWANQVQEIGLLQGQKVDEEFLEKKTYFHSRWNLYPDYDVAKAEDMTRFLKDSGGRIDRIELLTVNIVVLVLFIVVQLGAVAMILRRQDAW